jgi:hypothetical protein
MGTRNRTPATPAIHMKPGTGTDLIDSDDSDLGGMDKSIVLEGDMTLEELRDSLNTVSYHTDTPDFKSFTDNVAFMEERVLVNVHPSTDKNAELVIDVFNGGVPQRFIRGEWIIAKRKYVEVLARAKPFGLTTPEITDGNGNRTTKISLQHGMAYPFDMRDPNPRGQGWLQGILREA